MAKKPTNKGTISVPKGTTLSDWEKLSELGELGPKMSAIAVRDAIKIFPTEFKAHLVANGIDSKKATAIATKFRDSGRRSAPWSAFSKRVPGRPQDGKDGNRINRWLLPEDHKYYADERTATLVEIKYFLQTLSMNNAPDLNNPRFSMAFKWLVGKPVVPGNYLDPITLLPIDFNDFISSPRQVTSGHLFPLDRGGKHEPENTFLMTRESNMLQGNNTLPELIEMIAGIHDRHKRLR